MDARALQQAAAAAAAAHAAAVAASAAASTSGAGTSSGGAGSSASASGLPPGLMMDEVAKNAAMQYFLNQQYGMQQAVQTNDTFNLIQNAIASGIPTLDKPSIASYLGYGNTFTPSKGESFPKKYAKLLEVIEEIGRDVGPLYAGSKGANDRLRRQIIQARHLVRECLMEVDRSQR